MAKVTCWTDPGGCSTCKFVCMEPDLDPYCVHPKVLEQRPHGLNINSAIQDFCGENLDLREERNAQV